MLLNFIGLGHQFGLVSNACDLLPVQCSSFISHINDSLNTFTSDPILTFFRILRGLSGVMEVDISDLDAQIALLQAAKEKKLAIAARDRERKEREDAKVLVGVTPTKVKGQSTGPSHGSCSVYADVS